MRPIPETTEQRRQRDDARREELLEERRLALDEGGTMSGHGWRANGPVPDHVLDLEARLARLDLRMAELWVSVTGLTATVAELHAAVRETTKPEGAACGCAQRGDQPRVSARQPDLASHVLDWGAQNRSQDVLGATEGGTRTMTHAREPDWDGDEGRAGILRSVLEMSDEEAAAWSVVVAERRDQARAEGNEWLASVLDKVVHALGERHLRRMEGMRYMREATEKYPPPVCRPLTEAELADVDDDLTVDPEVAAAEAVAQLPHARTLAVVRTMAETDEDRPPK